MYDSLQEIYTCIYFSDETFTMTISYKGCVEVDASTVTSCQRYTETDWTTLPFFSKISTFQEASNAGFYSGSVCYDVIKTDSEGLSIHQNCNDYERVYILVLNVLLSKLFIKSFSI